MSEDLRTRAREVAESLYGPPREDEWMRTTVERGAWAAGWENGYLAHAAQQPSREELARVMREAGLYRRQADAILALFDGPVS